MKTKYKNTSYDNLEENDVLIQISLTSEIYNVICENQRHLFIFPVLSSSSRDKLWEVCLSIIKYRLPMRLNENGQHFGHLFSKLFNFNFLISLLSLL
jgi:hypothetical protein